MSKEINIQPIGKRVLIKPEEVENKTTGGLVIPPSATDDKTPAMGTILKLGTGKDEKGKEVSFDVKIGNKVFFKKYAPEEIDVEGEIYLLLNAEDILAIIK